MDQNETEAPQPPTWPPEEYELVLRKTVTLKDETFERVLLREPTMGEWEDIMSKPASQRARYAVSVVGGVPMAAVARMGVGDVTRGENYIFAFFETAQAIRDW